MQSFRVFLTTVVGLTVTGFAFVVAATFSFVIIAMVAMAALGGIAAIKAAPYVRRGIERVRSARTPARVWNDGSGLIIDA